MYWIFPFRKRSLVKALRWKGRLSKFDLFVQTSLDQLLLKLKKNIIYFVTKRAIIMKRYTVLSLSFQLVFRVICIDTLSTCIFVNFLISQLAISRLRVSSTCRSVNTSFCQYAISSMCNCHHLSFCQHAILSNLHFKLACVFITGNYSTLYFVNLPVWQHAISSTCNFILSI